MTIQIPCFLGFLIQFCLRGCDIQLKYRRTGFLECSEALSTADSLASTGCSDDFVALFRRLT